jgi:phosphonate transport system substrate-binding protein
MKTSQLPRLHSPLPLLLLLLLLLPLLLLSFLLPIRAQAQNSDIVFATYTYSTNDRLQNLEPLAAHLSEATGLPIRAVSYPTVQALIEAIRSGEADFAMMNTAGYLVLQRNHPDAATPMVNLTLGSESVTNYGGCLVARMELGIRTMEDVAALGTKIPLALVASSSTSGNLVPRLLLNSHGIADPESKFDVTYSGTHANVVADVLSGKAPLGGTGCAEVDKARLHQGFDDHAVVVGSFDDIPLGPVVHSAKVDASTADRVAKLLRSLHDDNPAVFTNFLQGWSEFLQARQFVPVSDTDYDPFRRMFGTNQALWKLIE